MFSYRDKDRRVQGLLQEKFVKQLLYQRNTNRLQQNTRQLQTNAQNQVNRMLVIIARKQTRIGELLREKFIFQLVIRQRDQNILNLQGQILALQNNSPNIQRIGMAGYIPPSFSRNYDKNIDYFINKFRRYLTASGNNLANNANRPNRTVVLANITLRQLIDYFKGNYLTVRQQYQQALFGITVQGSDSVGSYYTKFKKIARHANMGDNEFYCRFLRELSSDNQMEVHHMGLSRPIDEIFSSLEEIERYKAELVSGANPLLQFQQYIQPFQLYPSAEIEKLNSQIASLQAQMAQTNQVHSQNIQKPLDKKELEFLYVLAERLDTPLSLLETYNSLALNSYINEELERRLGTNDAFHVKAKLFKNSPFLDPQIFAIKKSSQRKSGRKSTRKSSKTKKKKSKNKSKKKKKSKSGRVHTARVDEQSDSDSSDNDTSSSESEDSSSSSESSSFESESEAEADAEINVNISRVKKK